MSILGCQLRNYRKKSGLSLKEVNKATRITDSRLSKIENGRGKCHLEDLIKLTKLYKVPIVTVLVNTGMLSAKDLIQYERTFDGVDDLDEAEKSHIQQEINLFNRKRKQK